MPTRVPYESDLIPGYYSLPVGSVSIVLATDVIATKLSCIRAYSKRGEKQVSLVDIEIIRQKELADETKENKQLL